MRRVALKKYREIAFIIYDLKILLCLVFLLAFLSKSFSQSTAYSEVINYSPTTPEVANIGKFVETPVAMYSGIPNISIPLAVISSAGLSVNVGLSYHAGGVRVEDVASWVGTGWSLNAGGSVTRVVRGIADDSGGGYLNTTNTIQNFLNTSTNMSAQLANLINQSVNGLLDYEADIYHYNFLGYSGKFVMDQSGNIIPIPHTDIRISSVKDNSKRIIGWIIVAPDGTKAYFGQSKDGLRTSREQVIGSTPFSGGKDYTRSTYTTGWNLMDLTDHTDKNQIEFSYTNSTYSTCERSGQQRYLNKRGEGSISTGIKLPTYFESSIRTSKIALIKGASGTISFIKANDDREDIPGDFALQEIVLSSNDSNEYLKKFSLSYENKTSASSSLVIPCGGNERYKRLFLSSVQEISENDSIPPYVFSYNNTALPDKFSFAQDFWGFYNGQSSNQSLIPTVNVKGVRVQGANRYSNEDVMKAGTLERITYPSRGYTQFIFEANRIGQMRLLSLIAERTQVQVVRATPNDLVKQGTAYNYSKTFTVVNNEYIENRLFINANFPCDPGDRDCGIRFTLKKTDNSFYQEILRNTDFYLTPGTYELSARVTTGLPDALPDFDVRIIGEQHSAENSSSDFVSGGLRVKEIKNYNADGSLLTQKSYEYQTFNDTTASSGGITSTPVFVEIDVPFNVNAQSALVDIVNSSSLNPFTATQSNYVGYAQVTEFFGSKSSNTGKKEYSYSFALDDDSGSGGSGGQGVLAGKVAPPPPVVLEWLRGNLLTERHFTRTPNGTYAKLKETFNNYVYYRSSTEIFNKIIPSIKMNKRGDGMYGFEVYNTLSEWFKLDSTKVIDYTSNGMVQQSTKYKYHENKDKHVFPIERSYDNNGESKLFEKTFYPDDVINSTSLSGGAMTADEYSAINLLKKDAQHLVGIALQRETWLNNLTKLETQRTSYRNWGNNIVKPQSVSVAKGNLSLEKRVDYRGYDDKGNVREVSKTGNIPIVYIRGYANEQVVAKIENATYTEIQDVLTTTEINNLNAVSVSEETVRNTIAKLRNHVNMRKAQVSAYTYKPLVGMTSMTDPRGITEFYQYDGFQRLKDVLDFDSNVLQHYRYNYRP